MSIILARCASALANLVIYSLVKRCFNRFKTMEPAFGAVYETAKVRQRNLVAEVILATPLSKLKAPSVKQPKIDQNFT